MKKSTLLKYLLSFSSIVLLSGFLLHTDSFTVDTAKSNLEWHAAKVTGKHHGTIKISKGEIKNNHGAISGSFEFDMNSIENKDIESPSSKTKLENHLKSADFFDSSKYPKAKFLITSVNSLKQPDEKGMTHVVKGMLTIKDITEEIIFNASLKFSGNAVTCSGEAKIDRTKFNIRYGSKTFFPDIGDKMIYDEFTLRFNVSANK